MLHKYNIVHSMDTIHFSSHYLKCCLWEIQDRRRGNLWTLSSLMNWLNSTELVTTKNFDFIYENIDFAIKNDMRVQMDSIN